MRVKLQSLAQSVHLRQAQQLPHQANHAFVAVWPALALQHDADGRRVKFQAGAESRAPLAVVVLGGVATSTLLTLLVVPVMYTYFDDLQGLFRHLRVPRLRRRLAGRPVRALGEGADAAAGD